MLARGPKDQYSAVCDLGRTNRESTMAGLGWVLGAQASDHALIGSVSRRDATHC